MTYARQFDRLPPGYLASTDPDFKVENAFAVPEAGTDELRIGTGVIRSGYKAYETPEVRLTNSDAATSLYGILIKNDSAYKKPDQTKYTELADTLVSVATRGKFTVRCSEAFTDVNLPVYCESTGVNKGSFRSTAVAGAHLVNNMAWRCPSYSYDGIIIAEAYIVPKVG